MRLLTKTTIYIATLSLFLFFIMGIIFFQVLKDIGISDLSRELTSMEETIEENLSLFVKDHLLEIPGIDSMSIQQVAGPTPQTAHFGDTLMYDYGSDQYKTFRYYEFETGDSESQYRIKLFKSTTPTDKLVERVTLMMTLMVILFLAGIFILNRFIFANLWKDFFNALEKLKQFDKDKEPVILGDPDIEEFVELKKVLERMTRRLASDYKELREYTDHTTHELQTPLAVIKTKTELLLQSANLGSEELELIKSIYSSADHLSRLNSTLALITRIENQQFTGKKEIHIADLLICHLEMLQELVALRGIKVDKSFHSPLQVIQMDQGLADVLVTNLLKNAIVHNVDGGKIILEIDENKLRVSNTGAPLAINKEELFNRFARNTKMTGNFGLGLSLVKKICDYYGFSIQYQYHQEMHTFELILKK